MTKGQWSLDEDSILKEKVAELGVKQWNKIAESIEGRVGKQCRERWYNHVSPDIKWGPWSEEEDAIMIEGHKEVGNKWTQIAKRLPGRPENSIKNRWNSVKKRRTTNNSDGSQLQAYINGISEAEKKEGEEEKEEEGAPQDTNLNHHVDEVVNDGDGHNEISHLLRVVFPTLDFNNKNWVSELLDSPMDSDLNPIGKN